MFGSDAGAAAGTSQPRGETGRSAGTAMRITTWTYPIAIAAFVAVIAAVLQIGEWWVPASQGAALARTAADHGDTFSAVTRLWHEHATSPFPRLLLQFLVVVAAARVCGALSRRLGQPSVIGEIAAGIALGPSVLGALAPAISASLFPAASLPVLQLFSQLGVILFMFVVGLELDWSLVRSKAKAAIVVSHMSILLPFLLGTMAAIPLYARYAPDGIPFHAFALFMGIAMSITAFPVLARILEERGMSRTPVGSTAIACAAVDDVTAWTLLAFVVAVVTAGRAVAVLLVTMSLAAAFVAVMMWGVRPMMATLLARRPGVDSFSVERLAIILIVVFAAAGTTEVIGVHGLFGAFVAGAVMPADAELRSGLRQRLEGITAVFLLPVFFALAGLRTEIGLLADIGAWMTCLAVIGLATAGKLAGSALSARAMGMDWNSSLILGTLMNTRGLMELVALNVGYDLGVISPEMFAVLVIMALVTTAMTGPLLDVLAHSAPAAVGGRSAPRPR